MILNYIYEKLNKAISKEKIYACKLFLINILIIVLAYSVYIFTLHYSEDSFEALLDIGALANTNLRNGRIIHYFLYTFFDYIHFNILEHQCITQLILSIVLSYGVTSLTLRFKRLLPGNIIWRTIIIDAGLLFIFFSPNFLFGWYYWPETCIGASLSMLITIEAILAWCKQTLRLRNIIVSVVLLCISVGMYQVYVELYVGLVLAYTMLKYGCKYNAKALKEYFIVVICGGISGFLNIAFMTILQNMQYIERDGRSAELSYQVIIHNIKAIINGQTKIWSTMYGFLPRNFLPIAVGGMVLFIICAMVTNKNKLKVADFAFVLLNLITIYILSFVPNAISGTLWLAPRTYIGIYAFIFMIIIDALMNIQLNKVLMKVFAYYLILIVFISMLRLVQLQTQTIVSNRFDEYEIDTIERYISQYEAKTNIKIDTIAYRYDEDRTYSYDLVKYVAFDNNTRGMAYDWCFTSMIKYYIDKDLILKEMTKEEYLKYFGAKNWDVFYPDQQLHFEGDTLYIAIY